MRILGLFLAVVLAGWGGVAHAQAPNAKVVATCGVGSFPLGTGWLTVDQTGDICGGGGGGGGGAVTIANGADVTQGAKADAAWTSGDGTVIAVLKAIKNAVASSVSGYTQGSTTSGQVGPLNQAAVTTSAPSYTTAQTSPLSMDTSGNLRTVFSAPLTSSFHFLSAASNNCTVVKNAAGWLWDYQVINTTTSGISDLRFYNKATTPSPGTDSALVVTNTPIPVATATNVDGGIVVAHPVGKYFTSGISVCLTGANADNDNTNAATGVNVNGTYQ